MSTVIQNTLNLITISFLLLIFALLTHDSHRIRYLSGLIMLIYMIQFISPIVTSITQFSFSPPIEQPPSADNENDPDSTVIQAISVQICKDTKKLVSSRFGIPENTFTISVTVEKNSNNEMELKSVTIHYYSDTDTLPESDVNAIAKYISDTLAVPCTFLIDKPETREENAFQNTNTQNGE